MTFEESKFFDPENRGLVAPHIITNQLGAPLPTEVPPICVQVPFLPQTPDLAVSGPI
jgi:hypothetical protein